MSKSSTLTEQERADLVAYLDGELTGEHARAIEKRLTLDARYRSEADSLKRTWDLLDFLPRSEPSPSFTERTLSKIDPIPQDSGTKMATSSPATSGTAITIPLGAPSRLLFYASLSLVWAVLLGAVGYGGYRGFKALFPREPGESELTRDLRLIENKRFYDEVDELEFLKQLDHPDLFGEDTSGL